MLIIIFKSFTISFNRYMVECEFRNFNLINGIRNVLIDTWWNVNCSTSKKIDASSTVLIDTWWNVNKVPGIWLLK